MSDEIIKVLDDLAKKFGVVIDWTSENVMPYLKDLGGRMVKYELTTSIIWLIAALILLTIITILFVITLNKYLHCDIDNAGESDDAMAIVSFLSILIVPFCLCVIGIQINDIVICNIIPEKIIYTEINNILS